MAKDPSAHQRGIINRYYEHRDTIHVNKLSEIVSDLYLAADSKTKAKLWASAQTALMRVCPDAHRIASIVNKQDIEAFARLVAEVDANRAEIERNAAGLGRGIPTTPLAPAAPAADPVEDTPSNIPNDSLEEENLKRALKAFRRRLKNTKRDDESRLGGRYVTRGGSNITAVQPPIEFPPAVWQKLAELGRLKYSGRGTYQLP